MQSKTPKIQLQTTPHFYPTIDQNHPNYLTQYQVYYGGRGGMKTWMVARALLIRGVREKHLILCTREYQNSIRDSVIGVLKTQCEALQLDDYYEFQKDIVYCKTSGTTIIFKGLHHNIQSVKSTEGITLAWLEEAQTTAQESLDILIPTINRNEGAQMFVTFNTGQATDPVYKDFVLNPQEDSYVCLVNYTDNPWVTKAFVKYAHKMRDEDYERYAHIFLGEPWALTDAQVLRGKISVREFELPTDTEELENWFTYYGCDWGFSVDPSALIKVHIHENTLYVSEEIYENGVEIIEYKDFFRRMDSLTNNLIRADNSRPEIISHLQKEGFNIIPAEKWNGSVEDGVSFLRGFDSIVVHPRCSHTIEEGKLWSYKTDRLTGDILPILLDKHNHTWDAIRYAIEPLIKQAPDPMIRIL